MTPLLAPDEVGPVTPTELLAGPAPRSVPGDERLWGFGGLHGGLALATAAAAMRDLAPGRVLRSVSGRFLRPIRAEQPVLASVRRAGRTVSATAASIGTADDLHMEATALLAVPGESMPPSLPRLAPPMPDVAPAYDLDVFFPPLELVPFARFTEIRPAGDDVPYGGGHEATLTAWMRLTDTDDPPDLLGLVILADTLAPSYSAVMTRPDVVPTVELSVRPTTVEGPRSSPWVLARATSRAVGPDGWVDEAIDLWAPDGTHLAAANQVRLVRATTD